MEYVVIIALLVAVIALIIRASNKKKEADRIEKTAIKPKTTVVKPATTVKPKPVVRPKVVNKNEYPILYAYSAAGRGFWVCKACETENPQGQKQCCVCHVNR